MLLTKSFSHCAQTTLHCKGKRNQESECEKNAYRALANSFFFTVHVLESCSNHSRKKRKRMIERQRLSQRFTTMPPPRSVARTALDDAPRQINNDTIIGPAINYYVFIHIAHCLWRPTTIILAMHIPLFLYLRPNNLFISVDGGPFTRRKFTQWHSN